MKPVPTAEERGLHMQTRRTWILGLTVGAVAALDDAQIARVIENYLSSDHMMEHADYPVFPGDVLFVDATVPEQNFTGTASHQWRPHVAGELRTHAIACRHSELLDAPTLETLGPLIARHLTG